MNLHRLRAVVIAGVVALVTTGLTGCHQWSPDPIAVTTVGDTAVARICLPMTLTAIRLTSGTGADSAVWEARGELAVAAGTELPLGEAPEGWSITHDDRAGALTPPFTIRVTADDDYGDHVFKTTVEPDTLQAGVWLDGYGEPTDSPCTREPCSPGWGCLNQWPEPTGAPTRLPSTWTPESTSPPVEIEIGSLPF